MSDGAEAVETIATEEPAAVVEQAAPEAAELAEQDGETEDQADDADTSEEDLPRKEKRGKTAHARINELTREKHELRRQLDALKRIATEPAQTTGQEPAPRPDRSLFETDAEYIEALTDWKVEQAFSKSSAQSATRATEAIRDAEWEYKVALARQSIPDYDDALSSATDLMVRDHVAEAMKESPNGAELLYHFATNPDALFRLNAMPPIKAALELARLETSLGKPRRETVATPKPMTKAPAPATPIAATSSLEKDPSNMSVAEYQAWRAAQNPRWAGAPRR